MPEQVKLVVLALVIEIFSNLVSSFLTGAYFLIGALIKISSSLNWLPWLS